MRVVILDELDEPTSHARWMDQLSGLGLGCEQGRIDGDGRRKESTHDWPRPCSLLYSGGSMRPSNKLFSIPNSRGMLEGMIRSSLL